MEVPPLLMQKVYILLIRKEKIKINQLKYGHKAKQKQTVYGCRLLISQIKNQQKKFT